MKFRKVFVDANVILDLFIPDRPFSEYSILAIDRLIEKKTELFTSCDLITTVYYVLTKADKDKALKSIEVANEIFKLIPFSNDEIIEAINLMKNNTNFKDLEDTVQYVLAKRERCDLILTNDQQFYSPDISLLTTRSLVQDLE